MWAEWVCTWCCFLTWAWPAPQTQTVVRLLVWFWPGGIFSPRKAAGGSSFGSLGCFWEKKNNWRWNKITSNNYYCHFFYLKKIKNDATVMLTGEVNLVHASLWQQDMINVIHLLPIKTNVNGKQKKLSSYSSEETKTRSPWSTRKQ